MEKTALILGATGGVGFEMARALARRGWKLRALARTIPKQAALDADWIKGDAMNRDDVMQAAAGVSLIVHGVNPPGYKNWRGLALPMLDNTIAAAGSQWRAYSVSRHGLQFWPRRVSAANGERAAKSEDAQRRDPSRDGREAPRCQRTRTLQSADRARRRFFGAQARNSWFSQGMITPGKPVRSVVYPGKTDVGHAWSYLPDVGETAARLIERESALANFDVFHMRGHDFARGVEMAERTRIAAGALSAPIKSFPWTLMIALSPFVRLFREMAEMRYLWTQDVRLDNGKLIAFLGAEPHTPIDVALRTTLHGLGCLADDVVAVSAEPVRC